MSDAFVLQLGLVLGLILAFVLGVGLPFGARLFTKDADVLQLIGVGIPVFFCQKTSIPLLNCLIPKNAGANYFFLIISSLQLLNPLMPWPLFSMV